MEEKRLKDTYTECPNMLVDKMCTSELLSDIC